MAMLLTPRVLTKIALGATNYLPDHLIRIDEEVAASLHIINGEIVLTASELAGIAIIHIREQRAQEIKRNGT